MPSNNGKAVLLRWKYDLKLDFNVEIKYFKAGMVSKGFMQIEGAKFNEAFSPVSRYSPAILILALLAKRKWSRVCLDIKTSFLNASSAQEAYVKQPDGFGVTGKRDQVYILSKAL